MSTIKNSITLAKIADGLDASSYFIETNYEEVLRLEGEDGVYFTPPFLRFRVYDSSNQLLELNSANTELSYFDLEDNEFKEIIVNYDDDDVTAVNFYIDESCGDFFSLLESGEVFPLVKFVYKKEGQTVSSKIISTKNGVSSDMAKLNIGANGINAAIGNSTLRFGADGLQVRNGSFKIFKPYYREEEILNEADFNEKRGQLYCLDDNQSYIKATQYKQGITYYVQLEEKLLYTDDLGNLTIKGRVEAESGYFKGRIEAESGSFTGDIYAKEGVIGGFYINNSSIYCGNNDIVLDGVNKKIIAKTIELGSNAKVADKIEFSATYFRIEDSINNFDPLGEYYELDQATNSYILTKDTVPDSNKNYYIKNIDAAIYNPNLHSGQLLKASNVQLTSEGKLNLGTLEMYGGTGKLDGYIRSIYIDQNDQANNGFWRINEDGSAQFNNITVNQAKIQNSILETNKVQNVGSSMIFKTAWPLIETQYARWVKIEAIRDQSGLSANDWVWDGVNYYQVKGIQSVNYYSIDDNNELKKIDENEQLKQDSIYLEDFYEFVECDLNDFNGETAIYEKNTNNKYIKTEDKEPQESKVYYKEKSVKIKTSNKLRQTWVQLTSDFIPNGSNILTLLGKSAAKVSYVKKTETNPIAGRYYYIKDQNGKYIPWTGAVFSGGQEYFYATFEPEDYVISINGNSIDKRYIDNNNMIDSYDSPNSLTISSFYMENDKPTPIYTKHLILGKLDESGVDVLQGAKGFGLYSDNVFLNGSLTTKLFEQGYAGINSFSNVSFNKTELGADTSPIVFWGGAETLEDIDEAPFQVSAAGSLYTRKAIIEESIVSGASIYGSDFYGASIRGWDGSKQSALKIFDTSEGVQFCTGSGDEEQVVFTINTEGFSANQQSFIQLNNNFATFTGSYKTRPGSPGISTTLEENTILFNRDSQNLGSIQLSTSTSNLNRTELNFLIEDSNSMSIQADQIKMNQAVVLAESLWHGSKMEVKIINDGCDIYVY